ncbi:hypothetical protein Tsubulata_021344 [Turnera subulata]|uniref:Uncharacterized protein n=1 Tax=Turnera subulata TaxID=218843 RepID=A0A9Q0FZU9_9ROSI|nr:hypothetical protein Tsubulata_021344 [Turnera subulata]
MHARHRSPGNGYRSNSMGMGLGASRISPDNSSRGHGFYNSEYRSFNNRGFGRGRGQFKSYQPPPQPPPRKGDIWMEAGRLAAEYLVSKGMLSQSALSGKWQNASFKKQGEDYPDFRQQEELTQEGRAPVHSRVGGGSSDSGFGRRRYNDDFPSRNYVKGRRRGEHYPRHSGSEWGREYGRGASVSDRTRVSPDMEGENDITSGHYEEPQIGDDFGDAMQKSGSSEVGLEREEAAEMGSVQQKYNYMDEKGSRATSFSDEKDESNEQPSNVADDFQDIGTEDEVKGSSDSYETEQQINPARLSMQHSAVENDHPGNNGSDLLALCKFAKVPTRIRSALTSRVPKSDQIPSNEGGSVSDTGHFRGSVLMVEDGSDDVPNADDVLQNTNRDSNCPGSEISKALPIQPAKDVSGSDTVYGAERGKCVRSQSFPDRIFLHENEKEQSSALTSFRRSSSVKEQGEKRASDGSDLNEAPKKQREWLPSLVTGADGNLPRSGSRENITSSHEERASPDQPEIVAASQDNFLNSYQFPKSGGEPSVTYAQEKQFFPNSFKICDLNLMEASDASDNHRSDPVSLYPNTMATEKAVKVVDVGLSISNANVTGEYTGTTSDSKDIEIIDLENDSTLDAKAYENSRRRMDAPFTGTEGLSSQGQNPEDVADVQIDNLMFSEFLTNFSNCNAVTEDINPIQNEMGLHNGEATLGDDDSIYMSLGEIPLSMPDF